MPTHATAIDERVSLIVAAGGLGMRVGSTNPKQFICIHQTPIWHYAVSPFVKVFSNLQVVVACPQEHLKELEGEAHLEDNPALRGVQFEYITGGKTRFHSVQNALKYVCKNAVHTFVHDAARCFISPTLIRLLYHQIKMANAAIPYVTSRDSVRMKTPQGIKSIDRERVYHIQTPQLFRTLILRNAYKQQYHSLFTDDATVVENAGFPLTFVEGEYENIKITYPQDIALAELLLPSV